MKKKYIVLLLTIALFILPIVTYAAAMVTTYGETVTKANNYIMTFRDRRKYLLFNKNYVYERNGFGDSSQFTMGGLLRKSEFDLSVYMNQSYLANGKEYWTLTNDGSNKYYIDAYVQSKNPSSVSGTRVTEYIKPGTIYSGRGTYSNPWVFDEGYAVDVISNNTDFGTVSPLGEQYVRPGDTLNYVLEQANGYYYNGSKDECGFVKSSSNKYESNYKIENIRKDITCTAVYELRTYKFDLLLDTTSVDFDGNTKSYTTNPSPNPIYYKYKTNWYSNSNTSTVINSITPPTMTGWTFGGYYYGNTKVIDASGNIIVKNLNLGTRNDFVDTDHILYAQESLNGFKKNTYSIKYNLNNGSFPEGAKHPTTATYDEIVEIDYPTRAGYSFEGWTHNGSATARIKNISTNATENFVPNSTKTKAKKFANLTPVGSGEVTMTANWKICPVGTYNTGSSISCTACPGSMTSNEGSTAITDCKITCAAGTYLASAGSSCSTCEKNYYCGGGTYNYDSTSLHGRTACPTSYPETESTGSSLKTQCRKANSCTKADSNHTGCSVTGTYTGSASCGISSCNHDGCTVGGSWTSTTTTNCSKSDCNHDGCSASGTWSSTYYACNCYHPYEGNYSGGSYTSKKSCDDGCWNACYAKTGSYETDGWCTSASSSNDCTKSNCDHSGCSCSGTYSSSSSISCTKADANHTGCTCTGNYSVTKNCVKGDSNHDGCTVSGTWYSYSPA